jgi:hypothetical protein
VQAAVWWVLTLHLVCLSWIFFRANTVADAWSVLAGIATRPGTLFVDAHVFGHCAVGVLVLLAAEAVEARRGLLEWLAARPVALRWGLYAATVFGITILGVDGGAQFIYFQF